MCRGKAEKRGEGPACGLLSPSQRLLCYAVVTWPIGTYVSCIRCTEPRMRAGAFR